MSEAARITSGDLAAAITPNGAELLSLMDGEGREYMTNADPAYWTGHAPLLFPIVGGLVDDTYRLDGAHYTLPRHGFARHSLFDLVDHQPHRALFRLRASDETRAVYPFDFVLEMDFSLSGNTLSVVARVSNQGAGDLPFSFGYHPAFAWPLPDGGDKLTHSLEFTEPEPAPIRRLDGAGLVASHEPSPVNGRTMPLHPSQFAADAMIWDDLASRCVTYRSPNGPALQIAFPDMPYLGVWQKPGADFICIEPWAGIADDAGFAGDLRQKRGVMQLAPGEARSFRMDVAVLPAQIAQSASICRLTM